MNLDNQPEKPEKPKPQGFLAALLQGIIRDFLGMWIPVGIGIVLGAVICVIYGLPLGLSLLGGVLVLAVYVAWDRL